MSFLSTLLQRSCFKLDETNLLGVTSIRSFALYKSDTLYEVHFPNTVTKIDENAFSECSSLKKVIFPNELKEIAVTAFSRCPKLTSITLTPNIESIGNYAFADSVNNNNDYLEEIYGVDVIDPSIDIARNVFGINSPWYKKQLGAILFAKGKLLYGYGNTFESIPETVEYTAKSFMGSAAWSNQPATLVIPNSVKRLSYIWESSDYTNSICKKVIVGTGVTEMLQGAMQVVGDTIWICKQPANLKITLPSKNLAYNKQATTMTLYTDNLSLKQYNWSADNVTATIKPLSEAPIN